MNTLSGLDNWRNKDSGSSGSRQQSGNDFRSNQGEFKSMRNFDDPKPMQRAPSYKSEKSLPSRSGHNFASTICTDLEEKLYHPSLTFECNDVEICVKMYDVYKTNAQAFVVPILSNDANHKHTARMCRFLGTNIHEVPQWSKQQTKSTKLGTLKELEPRKAKTIDTIISFVLSESDSDCSFLSYILQKVIKHALEKGYESLCLHELGMGRNPYDVEARTVIYTLF